MKTVKNKFISAAAAIPSALFLLVPFLIAPHFAHADITSNLIDHWNFDEGSGVTANDSGSQANNGTLSDFSGAVPSWVPGKIGPSALSFSGSNLVEVPGQVAVTGNTLTVSMWIQEFNRNIFQNIFVKEDQGVYDCSSNCDFEIYLFGSANSGGPVGSDGSLGFYFDGHAGGDYQTGTVIPDNNWHLLTFVRNGDEDDVYIDGNQVASTTGEGTANFANTSAPSAIGGDSSGSFSGLMDDVRIYDRALTSADVLQLYNSSIGPAVTTQMPNGIIAGTTATGFGDVTADNGSTITERGIVWSTHALPTTSDNKATATGTLGFFSAQMTGLTKGTVYHVRAYATSALGTGYGNEVTFKAGGMATIDLPPNYLVLNSGLLGYWALDGNDINWSTATAATVKDDSGNGNTGTISEMSQAASPVPGKMGQALYFRGINPDTSSQLINVGNNTLMEPVGIGSVSAWAIAPSPSAFPSSGATIIGNCSEHTLSYGYCLYFWNDGKLYGQLGNGAQESGGTTGYTYAQDGKWHLYTLTWTNSTIDLYDDGALVLTTPNTNSNSSVSYNGANTNIGADGDGIDQFLGPVDDVRIYGTTLSAQQVAQLYAMGQSTFNVSPTVGVTSCGSGLSCGLIGYWTFDGKNTHWSSSTAATTDDTSGNGNTGTLNSMNQATAPAIGKAGQALNFNGSSSYVSVSGTLSTQSVAFWVKPATNSASMINLTSGAYVTASAGALSATGFTSPTIYVNGAVSSTLKAGVWNHVVVTTGSAVSANAITIGKANSAFTNGSIDDVRFYNRALSAQEVQQLYAVEN